MARGRWFVGLSVLGVSALAGGLIFFGPNWKVGTVEANGVVVPSAQTVQPAGQRWNLPARPVDIVRRSDGRLFVKTISSVVAIDGTTGAVLGTANLSGGASLHGLALTPDGRTLLASDAASGLHIFNVASTISSVATINLKNGVTGGASYPCGIAVSSDGKTAYVCLSRANTLAIVDLGTRAVTSQVGVAPAPFDVALSGSTAIVSCWGRRPTASDVSAPSSGTPVTIDSHGIAVGGTICFYDLTHGVENQVLTGHQPSQIAVASNGYAYVANAGDETVTQWDVAHARLNQTVSISPDGSNGPGAAPNALALSSDEKTLYVACGGLNATAVVTISNTVMAMQGLFACDWYPIGVAVSGDTAFVVNGKGIGSRGQTGNSHGVYDFTGTISTMPLPVANIGGLTAQAMAQATALKDTVPVPPTSPLYSTASQPSPIKHVFYVIRENRTYDQILGDVAAGDGSPALVTFGQNVTPNAHAIVSQFVLLDNFYCNGVNSADGHAWAVEGNATSYFERAFGGWTRSYPFGDDPLSPNASGFIWNDALEHGRSVRNYGEFDYAGTQKSFAKNLLDLKNQAKSEFTQNIGVAMMRAFSQRSFPGWNMEIPDQVRAARFISDFAGRDASGTVPDFSVIYLPEDHTGASVSAATCVADNDYGLGLVVQAISHSKVWPSSAIFVVEDDAQAGYDHVDGHRSPCFVISPYAVHGQTVSSFYSQASVLHTMEQILRLPPMNRMDAIAPLMVEAFQPTPDYTPYNVIGPNVTVKPAPAFMKQYALDLSKPDQVDPKLMNRLIWREMRPGEPYPAGFEGSHGKGLAARGLTLERIDGLPPQRDPD
jgi:YVTN family beta-propeller protein